MPIFAVVAIVWVLVAVMAWIVFVKEYAWRSSDLVIPGIIFRLGIALWPISIVILIVFWMVVLLLALKSMIRPSK